MATRKTGKPRGRPPKPLEGDDELLAIALALYLKGIDQLKDDDTFVIAAKCFTPGTRVFDLSPEGVVGGLEFTQTGKFGTIIANKANTYRKKWERWSGYTGKAEPSGKTDQEALARVLSAALVWEAFFSSDTLAGPEADFMNLFVAHTFKDFKVSKAMVDRIQELRPSLKVDRPI